MKCSFTMINSLLFLAMTGVMGVWGIELRMDRIYGNTYDQLVCDVVTKQADKFLLYILEISVTDMSDPLNKVKLASSTVLQTDVHKENENDGSIKVSGGVSRYQAKLDIWFSKTRGLELGNFLCELTYIGLSGSIKKSFSELKPNLSDVNKDKLTDNSDLILAVQVHELRNQFADTVNVLANRTAELEESLVQLIDRMEPTGRPTSNTTCLPDKTQQEYQDGQNSDKRHIISDDPNTNRTDGDLLNAKKQDGSKIHRSTTQSKLCAHPDCSDQTHQTNQQTIPTADIHFHETFEVAIQIISHRTEELSNLTNKVANDTNDININMDQLSDTVNLHRNQTDHLTNLTKQLSSTISQMFNDTNYVKEEVDQLTDTTNIHRDQTDHLTNLTMQVKNEMDQLTDTVNVHRDQTDHLTNLTKQLSSTISQMSNDTNYVKEEMDQLTDTTNIHRDQTDHLTNLTVQVKEEIDQLTDTTNLYRDDIKQLSDSVDALKRRSQNIEDTLASVMSHVKAIDGRFTNMTTKLEKLLEENHKQNYCYKGMQGVIWSPRRPILVMNLKPALCDTVTDGGGWIVIQRRVSGDVDFYRGWEDYKNGFGNVTTDYWLGNEVIHQLTSLGNFELRVDMLYKGSFYHAVYSSFTVADESSNYKLKVGDYRGNAGDSMSYSSNAHFSTFDRDNDDASRRNCGIGYHGGFWYKDCAYANVNGEWGVNSHSGATWYHIEKSWTALSTVEMKIRSV